ncbi:MAG: hypothetical protein M1829_003258 [Trizodia sp. TS-e1964]|nr:MAG: hypothetical protein M1829_003258 [Trizodia sp. TS-e1964]
MSDEERNKAEAEEEQDMINESIEAARRDEQAREASARLDAENTAAAEQAKTRRRNAARKQSLSGAPLDEKASRAREERLGEIEVLMSTKKCPGRRCQFRVQNDGSSSKRMSCAKCSHVFCWNCLTVWTARHLKTDCEPSEQQQLTDALALSLLEAERLSLETEQRVAAEEAAAVLAQASARQGVAAAKSAHEAEVRRKTSELAKIRRGWGNSACGCAPLSAATCQTCRRPNAPRMEERRAIECGLVSRLESQLAQLRSGSVAIPVRKPSFAPMECRSM